VEFRAAYELVSHPPVLVSENQAGLHSRQRPARLTASADAGWRGLRWASSGGETAVARGEFHTLVWVPIGYRDVVQRRVSYKVIITLSRVRPCVAGRPYYTRLSTRFLTKVPRAIRRQAKPPSTASCLD
jgi:hypothetical protein